MELKTVPLDKIENVPAPTSHARQMSLLEVGQVHPIKLRVHNGIYQIVEGRRRIVDSREAGKSEILALVEEMTDEQVAVQSLVSNITRSYNPMSEARDIARLRQASYSQEQIARMTGTTQGFISQREALLNLLPELQDKLARGEMTFSCARVAVKLPENFQKILAELDRPTLKAAKELLQERKEIAIDFDDLGVPDAPDDYIPPLVIKGEDARRLANGKAIEISWNGTILTVSRKETQ